MRKLKFLLAGLLIMFGTMANADEGMWLLTLLKQLNIDVMQQKGCKLTAEQIYSVNQASVKDAIIIFGNGCTGEIVSDRGLILTNHHCGYGAIQEHSSTTHDYLADGFWAKSFEEEIPTPGLTATFLNRIEDVTAQVETALKPEMNEDERSEAAWKVGQKIAKKATEGTTYFGRVQAFFGGNQYLLLVYERFTDVRMVGAPPSSIGKFGADTDNWMWPRHTGDFSVFRVYADKDNKPAEYATSNVPFTPKHSLPVSIAGVKPGDFTMIMGFPGSTQRYMTSYEVEERMNVSNEARIHVRGVRQEILLNDMLADQAIKIKYASKYSGSTNYWKNSIGMNKALKRLKIAEKKRIEEEEFTKWLKATPERTAKYANAIPLIKDAVEGRGDLMRASIYLRESILRGTELVSFASSFSSLQKALEANDTAKIGKNIEQLKAYAPAFYKDYSLSTDQKVAKAMFKLFAENIDKKFQPTIFGEIGTSYEPFINKMYSTSIFADSSKVSAFLNNPNAEVLKNDMAFKTAESVIEKYREISDQQDSFNQKWQKGQRLFIAGILEMNQGKAMYPDANFTMRLTYGEVKDYYPMDAVHYDYITYLDGVMEKEDPDNWEFVVAPKLKELYKSRDYGRYGVNGKMPVAFISTNDITGGNSGSPIMNANGELIGLAFDGNWEAMSGDIVFEPQLQRCINVDIRYVLFIIDKYAGCTRLIDEMTIVDKPVSPAKSPKEGKKDKKSKK